MGHYLARDTLGWLKHRLHGSLSTNDKFALRKVEIGSTNQRNTSAGRGYVRQAVSCGSNRLPFLHIDQVDIKTDGRIIRTIPIDIRIVMPDFS